MELSGSACDERPAEDVTLLRDMHTCTEGTMSPSQVACHKSSGRELQHRLGILQASRQPVPAEEV